MHRTARTAIALLAIAAASLSLSACSTLFGPSRDANGRVTGTTVINSPDLTVGDCFSFVDGSEQAKSSVTPCTNVHTYIVIGSGSLTEDAVAKDGLQNAVSGACAASFTDFKSKAAEGVKPEQQFVVSTDEKDGKKTTNYLCVATDSSAVAAG